MAHIPLGAANISTSILYDWATTEWYKMEKRIK